MKNVMKFTNQEVAQALLDYCTKRGFFPYNRGDGENAVPVRLMVTVHRQGEDSVAAEVSTTGSDSADVEISLEVDDASSTSTE